MPFSTDRTKKWREEHPDLHKARSRAAMRAYRARKKGVVLNEKPVLNPPASTPPPAFHKPRIPKFRAVKEPWLDPAPKEFLTPAEDENPVDNVDKRLEHNYGISIPDPTIRFTTLPGKEYRVRTGDVMCSDCLESFPHGGYEYPDYKIRCGDCMDAHEQAKK